MFRVFVLLAVLFGSTARAAAPVYSAESIVNGADFAAGALAPNAVATIFGTDLAWWTETLTEENTRAGMLPFSLADVRVYVGNYPAPLLYVSPTQINFLIPIDLRPGPQKVWVMRQGVAGPEVSITLAESAPHFFSTADGYVIAQHTDYTPITRESPARPGEVIVVYATGLGLTRPSPRPGEIPDYPGLMARLESLRVTFGGVLLPADRILYAGLTPGWAGLYQLNLKLPDILETDPELQGAVGEQVSSAGLKLATSSQ